MSLMTYEDARPYARSIKNRTTARIMPPWHIERNVGITEFKDDPSLTDAEIATLAAWADQGAPRGDMKDLPPPREFLNQDDNFWNIGTPDLIVSLPIDHVVPPASQDVFINYISDSGLTEDRFIKAVESKPGPGARQVVHHLLTFALQELDESEKLLGFDGESRQSGSTQLARRRRSDDRRDGLLVDGVTYLTEEDYKQMVAERAKRNSN
jgi:hypothetical protein